MAKRKIQKKTEKKTSQEELQQKYLQLQMIENQMQQAQKELTQLELKQQEITALRDSLDELKNIKAKSKTFAPLGLGIYAQGTVTDVRELLVNVGAGVMVKKKVADVRDVLDNQLAQFNMLVSQINQNMQIMANQAQHLEAELRK